MEYYKLILLILTVMLLSILGLYLFIGFGIEYVEFNISDFMNQVYFGAT